MHLGHHPSFWNPKMGPYIYSNKDKTSYINLVETVFRLEHVLQFLTLQASQGKRFLFIGTEKQATAIIAETAASCHSFFVNEKWLGGMLTNWKTMKKSIGKLSELERAEKEGVFESLPKKEAASTKKRKDRLTLSLGGLKRMTSVPDVVIIVGQPTEMNAVRECQKMGLRSVTILDTDCDPSMADLFIPANDDSVRSLDFLLTAFKTAIQKGQSLLDTSKLPLQEEVGHHKRGTGTK
jgi:small subunit ribosomal protein S2